MTPPDTFNRLLETASEQDRIELQLVHNGRVTTLQAYRKAPGRATKTDMDAAREAYDETLARLVARYFPADSTPADGERFRNRKQALDWLKAEGHKISQGKFYQDCAAGFPLVHQDGTVSRWQVMQYARQQDPGHRSGHPESGALVEAEVRKIIDDARKAAAAADIEEMKAETMRREQDREWIRQDDAWAALAATVGVIKDTLRHHFYQAQTELVHHAAGDPARAPELYEATETIINRALNALATRGRLEGVFEQPEEEAPEQ